MDTKITKEWGYRVMSPTTLNFYHVLLPQVGIGFLIRNLNFYKEIVFKEDKSVVISSENPMDLSLLIRELESVLRNMEAQYAQTDNFTYKVSDIGRDFLKNWSLAVEGGIALIVAATCESLRLAPGNFELIDSRVGGIYLHPFTVLFEEDHAKVIHPIKVSNYLIREQIERTIAISMKGILQRVEQAQEGYEGMALLSYIQEKTDLGASLIAKTINEKSKVVRVPKHSPLFKSQ